MANKFQEKKILAELLNDLYNVVEEKENETRREYKVVGEEQDKDWRTGELKWEDDEQTIPKMTAKWDYAPKEELTEEDMIRLNMCQHIKTQLEKML